MGLVRDRFGRIVGVEDPVAGESRQATEFEAGVGKVISRSRSRGKSDEQVFAERQEAARRAEAERRERIRKEALRKEEARKKAKREAEARIKARAKEKAEAKKRKVAIFSKKKIGEEARRRAKVVSRETPLRTEEIKVPIPEIAKRKPRGRGKEILDIVTGGAISQGEINKEFEGLNERVEKFNKRFGGRTLSEKELNRAKAEEEFIEREQKRLAKKQDALLESGRTKVSELIFGGTGRLTTKEREALKTKVPEKERELIKVNKKIETAKGLDKVRLKAIKKGLEKEIKRRKEGRPQQIAAGEFPVIPAIRIPRGIQTIRFVGKQKTVGNKIITDLVFTTSKGRVGIARGATITKGDKAASVILGRSGKVRVKLPSGKKKITNIQTFKALEASIGKPKKVKIIQEQIFRRKKLLKARGTKVQVIKRNLNILRQEGMGRVVGVKGHKFIQPRIRFPSGKIVKKKKKFTLEDFASISHVFTKKRLSIIIGKTITTKGSKARFIGLIKGTKKPPTGFKISRSERQQFKRALKQVASAVAAQASKAEPVGRTTKFTSAKATILSKVPGVSKVSLKSLKEIKPTVKVTKVQRRVVRIKSKRALATRTGVRQKLKVKQKTRIKQKLKTKQVTRQKTKQKARTAQRTLQKQRQAQRVRLKLKQAQVQRAKAARAKVSRVPRTGRVPRFPRLILIKRRKVRRMKVRKTRDGYDVFAKPIKTLAGKKTKRMIKVNKAPVTKKRAEDIRNYVTDTSLGRTAKIKKTKKKLGKSGLKVPKGYGARTAKKFRKHRISKGKRIPLKKGTVIEKRKRLLDTIQEKRRISLRRRIKQITKKPRPRLKSVSSVRGSRVRSSRITKRIKIRKRK